MTRDIFAAEPVPWKPHGYQKKGVKFLLEHACGALFLDPGLGKTSITLAALKILFKQKHVSKVLIIAPLRVCYSVWPNEIDKWDDFSSIRSVILHGRHKDELLKTEADIYLINPEGLEWLLGAKGGAVNNRRWKELGFDMLVIDELSKFKHTRSGRFKLLRQVLHTFSRRWGLTGSPAANGLLDLFGQCYVIDQGRSLGQYTSHYRTQYFVPSGYMGYTWVPQPGAEERIYERLSPLVLRMAAEDYLEMPVLVENNIKVDLPDKVMDIYKQLEDDLITKIDDREVTAATAAVASGKCRQVASGGVYLTPELQITGFKMPSQKREWVDLHTEKIDALADLVDELQGSPLLVAYDFEHDLARIRAKFGKDVPYIGGGVTPKRSAELERLWNNGELPVLFGHPASIAHGLNLQQMGNHIAWLTLTWDYELYDQFIRRVRRQGNKSKRVFVHHIIARDTIDEVVLQALKSKNRVQQALFKGLQELSKRRKI